jgi:dTMP kinase
MKQPAYADSSNRMMLSNPSDRGVLIAFEGLDGSGKTTQRKLFKSWLRHMQEDVVVTKWNSSSAFKPIIKNRKATRSLDPISYAALHAADFWHRHETVIEPSLRDGMVVLADRYIFTGLARDAARRVDPKWDRTLYAGARKPNLTFYFDTPVPLCAERITAAREISFYESGQDVTGLDDPLESYLRFAETVSIEYRTLSEDFAFVTIDGSLPIYDQHRLIRDTYINRLGLPAEESVLPMSAKCFSIGS